MLAKPVITPKVVPTKIHPIGKETVWLAAKSATSSHTETVTSVLKNTVVVFSIDVEDEDKISLSVDDSEATLTEDKIGNVFQGASSKEESEI